MPAGLGAVPGPVYRARSIPASTRDRNVVRQGRGRGRRPDHPQPVSIPKRTAADDCPPWPRRTTVFREVSVRSLLPSERGEQSNRAENQDAHGVSNTGTGRIRPAGPGSGRGGWRLLRAWQGSRTRRPRSGPAPWRPDRCGSRRCRTACWGRDLRFGEHLDGSQSNSCLRSVRVGQGLWLPERSAAGDRPA